MNLELFEGFGAAESRDELKARLLVFANELEFELFTMVVVDKDHAGRLKYSSVSNAPDAWQQTQHDPKLAVADPVHSHLRDSPRPLIWSQDTYVKAGAADLWDFIAPHGYKVGVAVTFPLGPGRKLILSVDRNQALPKDATKIVGIVGMLQLLSAYAQDNAAIRSMVPTKPLSPHQQRVMALVAAGKSNSVIADILKVSPDTIAFHLKAVFARLGVSTRQQAVLEVERLNLIPQEMVR